MSIHVVSQGETIADIAAEYGVSPNRLSFDNQLSEQDHLVAGQALLVDVYKRQKYNILYGVR